MFIVHLSYKLQSLTNECTFYSLTSIHPTYVSTYFGHCQRYTDIVTSLFTHSLGIKVEHYAAYSNWQSPIAKTKSQFLQVLNCIGVYIYIVLEVLSTAL